MNLHDLTVLLFGIQIGIMGCVIARSVGDARADRSDQAALNAAVARMKDRATEDWRRALTPRGR
ncbi:hypothetical protein [Streptomyces sp. NPDC006638]|uniref:hypothetical protein n=1 Tax=Streptomyces sp. NPDC006638 TaxID=3157183 RepID=UPI0033BAB078